MAALMAMLIHDSAKAWIFPAALGTTSLGIRPSRMICWGFGTAPCVDRTLAENTRYIHNVVLQVYSTD